MIYSSFKKYGNKKTIVNGISFDSKKEAKRYQELLLLERAGIVQNIELQPVFILQEKFDRNGEHHRKIEYKADFRYIQNGQQVVEDTKGFKTEVYKIKKKLLLFKYPEINFIES